jgi:hypothetical protein
VDVFVNRVRDMPADVDADFFHHGNGIRIDFIRRMGSSRKYVQRFIEGFEETFRHLTPAAIPGTDHQNFFSHKRIVRISQKYEMY